MTLDEALELLGHNPNRVTVERYIARAWVKPARREPAPIEPEWEFEEIDLARVQLVHQLHQELQVGDDAMEIVLHLLDQLYGLREQMRVLTQALSRQPEAVRAQIAALLGEAGEEYR